ncbi:MAG: polyribonucleotide nucleotidyltransferase [Candidatus Chaera renei]|uniref:Polyribonucleotide nucleotidyltransferase n=1 Tax=Candidatus Chaera renei TaxID=2506947 RepID=A0A4Q0AKF5_9BACT|nr:MAG: polyribonucleotide nucleotidyltransferase [Candidatus Chaera renei]
MTKTINPLGRKTISLSADFCGRQLTLETGRLAFQASGAVTARMGDTVVLGLVTAGKPVPGLDYFPLSIDYEEKMYAAGKISGSRFIKREGRPSDEAVLAGRLIDRPIRPLFPKGYRNELQGIATVLSLDPQIKPDMVAMVAISSAMLLAGVPFDGPVAGARVGLIDGALKLMPSAEELEASQLDLVVAGTKDAVMMVEAGGDQVDEATMVSAIEAAHQAIQPVLDLQRQLVEKVGPQPQAYELFLPNPAIEQKVYQFVKGRLGAKVRGGFLERRQAVSQLEEAVLAEFVGDDNQDEAAAYLDALDAVIKQEVRRAILEEKIRPDNRTPRDIRPLSSEVGVLPRTHGSSLFTRGTTQALNITTLAPLSYAQMIDTMEEDREKRFIHHYNMPGYTVGEVRRLGSPGRREIGHGALAERGLRAVIPDEATFPYTIRTVSEILSSNGSTSMASVCSGCLSLMDAGVPIKAPVSGIAMGLVSDGNGKNVILSDIQGIEDFAGDMDFKVVGTAKGITALQMDIKIKGITPKLMAEALDQAKAGRLYILEHMLSTLPAPRGSLSPYAPRIEKIMIKPEKIREVIGKGGETINKIIAETGAEIDIKDDGLVTVAAVDGHSITAAIQMIQNIVAEPEVGKVYDGVVVKIMEFGAFVNIMPGHDGLVHISQMAEHRVEKVTDMVKEGDKVRVKLTAIDELGRLNLTMKGVS